MFLSIQIVRQVSENGSTTGRDSPLEVPREEIAHAMEAATAATSTHTTVQEDEGDEAMTTVEPEMEIDMADMVDEAEPDERQQEDSDEDEDQEEIAERRPVIMQEHLHLTDPVLTQARISMQDPYNANAPAAYCIDAKSVSFVAMACIVVQCMHKSWVGTMRWTNLKYEHMLASFQNGNRCDVLDIGLLFLKSTHTHVSRGRH